MTSASSLKAISYTFCTVSKSFIIVLHQLRNFSSEGEKLLTPAECHFMPKCMRKLYCYSLKEYFFLLLLLVFYFNQLELSIFCHAQETLGVLTFTWPWFWHCQCILCNCSVLCCLLKHCMLLSTQGGIQKCYIYALNIDNKKTQKC